ncbi:MAG: hypothetical protein DRO98_06425 [Archaeoglobales archaeon]|nr:MAG: hypothetical protein DRO98_06425 [Archaeoglobales archaeon]
MWGERSVAVFSIIGALATFFTVLLALGVSYEIAAIYSLLVFVIVLLMSLLFKVGDIGRRLDAHDRLALVAYEFLESIVGEAIRRREPWSPEDFARTFVDRLWEAYSRTSRVFTAEGLGFRPEYSEYIIIRSLFPLKEKTSKRERKIFFRSLLEEIRRYYLAEKEEIKTINSLLNKYKRGELTDIEEAKMLWQLLKEEKEIKLSKGDIAAAVSIEALMLAIGAFILSQLLRKE